MLKRAGLDYWSSVDLTYHEGIGDLFAAFPDAVFYFVTKFGKQPYSDFDYSNESIDIFFVFGKETTGLPEDVLAENEERCLRIPMNDNIRALNLSNTAAILIYEALRQQSFLELS